MRIRGAKAVFTVAAAGIVSGACEAGPAAPGPPSGPPRPAHAEKKLDVALCAPGETTFTTASTNPWFPLTPGHRWTLEGEEDGEPIALVITVLEGTRVIEGVTTRIVEERESEGGDLTEVSWNYFAETDDGTVCYFGEDVDIYEDGEIVHDGAWCADEPGNAPGIAMPADPVPGTRFRMEVAPGVAEDEGRIVGIGPVEVPAGTFEETLRVRESNPLDGDKDHKVYAAGTGIVIDGPLELVAFDPGEGPPAGPVPTDQTCGI